MGGRGLVMVTGLIKTIPNEIGLSLPKTIIFVRSCSQPNLVKVGFVLGLAIEIVETVRN